MSRPTDPRQKPPPLWLCLAILAAVCVLVGVLNRVMAPGEPVVLHRAEAATAAPWVCTPSPSAKATAVPATVAPTVPPVEDDITGTWVLNTNSKRFHRPGCSSVNTIKESNRGTFSGPRQELLDQGYQPCGICKP